VTSKVWSEIQPQSGGFTFQPGERYAVLADVSLNFTLEQIKNKAQSEGFDVTYAWETGDPNRATYQIDNWLASIPADTTSNHRWVYAEGNFSGAAPWVLGAKAPWPLTIYYVSHVFEAVDAPDQPDAPAAPALPPASATTSAAAAWSAAQVAWSVFGVAVLLAAGVDAFVVWHRRHA
jgi:hypothetical protein